MQGTFKHFLALSRPQPLTATIAAGTAPRVIVRDFILKKQKVPVLPGSQWVGHQGGGGGQCSGGETARRAVGDVRIHLKRTTCATQEFPGY